MPKCVIYARVSSREQEDEGYSIEAQLKLLREYAAKHGYEVVREYVEAHSAKEAGRKEFNAMVKFIHSSREVKTILVEKVDRLYRNFTDAVRLGIEEREVVVVLVKQGQIINRDSKSSELFMHNIHLVVARNYIDNLKEETSKGLLAKAESGEFPSKAPQGYINNRETKRIDPHPTTSKLVRRLFNLYATGEYSLDTVSKKIAEEGLKAAGGRSISRAEIAFILGNPIYYGMFRWRNKLYRGVHEPIVNKETFDAVQRVMKRYNKPRRSTKRFAYRGLLSCGRCGCLYTAEVKKGKYTYYHCSKSKGPCDNSFLREEDLDRMFEGFVRSVQPERRALDFIIERLKVRHEGDAAHRREVLGRLRAEMSRLEGKMEKAYNDRLDGTISDDWWKVKSTEWRATIHDTEAAIDRIAKGDAGEFDLGVDLLQLASEATDLFRVRSPDEKRRFLGIMASNFRVDGKSIVPTYKKPFDLLAKGLDCQNWLPESFNRKNFSNSVPPASAD